MIDLGENSQNPPTTEQKLQLRKAIGVNDESGKLYSDQIPSEISARIQVLNGSTSSLSSYGITNAELAIDTTTQRIVYGSAGCLVDPLAYHNSATTNPIDIMSLQNVIGLDPIFWNRSARFITVATGIPTIRLRTSTGYAKALRWDGTFAPITSLSGDPVISFGTAPASPYDTRMPKSIAIFPCTSAGSITGHITEFNPAKTTALITYADLTNLTQLAYVYLGKNPTSFPLTTFDCTGLSAVIELDLGGCNLKYLDTTGLQSIQILTLNDNPYLSNVKITPGCYNLYSLGADNCRLNSNSIDHILNSIANIAIREGEGYINMTGSTNGAPTANSAAARSYLISRGWTINTN